jgi:hypothetical protein
VLSNRNTRTAQRKTLQSLGALLLLGVWSLALAGPMAEPGVSQSVPSPVHGSRAAMLNMALPALAPKRLQTQPLRFDETRATRVDPRDSSPATENERSAERQPAGGLAIPWRESREIANPGIVSLLRNYRRDGLPIVHLYQTNQNLLAIGLNNHGVPGIYFTRHIGG